MKNKKITLESTTIAFNKWRERRKAGESVPDELWQMVHGIYDHYPHTVLCQKLNIRVAQLKSRGLEPNSENFTPPAIEEDKASAFVHVPPTPELPVEAIPPIQSTTEIPSVQIRRPDGTQIIFKHHDTIQLTAVLQQLIGG